MLSEIPLGKTTLKIRNFFARADGISLADEILGVGGGLDPLQVQGLALDALAAGSSESVLKGWSPWPDGQTRFQDSPRALARRFSNRPTQLISVRL
jgi:hypothetical protein